MRDELKVAKAVLDIERLLSEYINSRDPIAAKILTKIIARLASDNVLVAAERIQASYGDLKIIK